MGGSSRRQREAAAGGRQLSFPLSSGLQQPKATAPRLVSRTPEEEVELSQSGKPALPADVSELLIPPYSRLPRKQKAEIAAQLMLIAERQWWASAKIYLDYCYEKKFEEEDGQAQPSS